ncbi:DASH family cryptochrome [Algoriphagus namhaensis]|uniref:Cryptochrome DASH n=1 Tax=Algoriphagus namhaensis TaxID=915353 RepID=A0ABV8AQ07_9BACT
MKYGRSVVWFRNDLRVRDNETLTRALAQSKEVIPVFCIDPRSFATTNLGFPKMGELRKKFLLESILNLKESLQNLNADLIILTGHPEEILTSFTEQHGAQAIFFSEEVTAEEVKIEHQLEKKAWSKGIATESFWQSTLYHIDDLPMPVSQLPEVFTQFRKSVEKLSSIRRAEDIPKTINFPRKDVKATEVDIQKEYGLEKFPSLPNKVMKFDGGECSGMERLGSYFWKQDLLKIYKETRNGLLGLDYSSKFSPWLALGCISPRSIFWEVKRYEKERKKNQSTYWLVFELIWRDYFRFICKKHGNKVFQIEGIKNQGDSWRRDSADFQRWCEGKTGVPFVDANMRELNTTGFMSNRGRQNVASFLVNDLNIDWTWGASYFESKLIDYDVCSNWGNWMYVGGVGNDPRENRYFNIIRQARNYDRNGDFVRFWIPELASIEGFDIHQPQELPANILRSKRIELGKTYPEAMVEMEKWM